MASIGAFPTASLSGTLGVFPVDGGSKAIWHKSAPGAVRHALGTGDPDQQWNAWKAYLKHRAKPVSLLRQFPGAVSPVYWALACIPEKPYVPDWLVDVELCGEDRPLASSSLEKDLQVWMAESHAHPVTGGGWLPMLVCAHALPRLVAALSPQTWWALLGRLLRASSEAKALSLLDDPLHHQWLCGELPLTLAYQFPELHPCRRLKPEAFRALTAGLVDLLDGEGLPHAKHLPLMRPLLACWTRCLAMASQLKGGGFSKSALAQYRWLVRHALRLTRPDCAHVFSSSPADTAVGDLFGAALELAGDKPNRRIASLVLPGAGGLKKPGKRGRKRLPKPSTHSEWAATAVLRPRWSRKGERLNVVYAGRQLRMEFNRGKDVLWSGPWELEVRVNGQVSAPVSDWEELCWVSDKTVDHLELGIDLSGGVRVQRQFVLARHDRFLMLADVVLADPSQRSDAVAIEYRSVLPLCPGVVFRPADQTREGALCAGKRRALVLPLALPEWREDAQAGELFHTPQGLALHRSSLGHRLYAPLWIDLDRRRQTAPLTWRQLTVAESLVAVADDVAVGYRVAVGDRQWLVYRSLAEQANRTVLGHNLSTEMLVARFHRSGEVESLIEIEG